MTASTLTPAQIRDLRLLHAAIEAKSVRTGLELSRKGMVRVVRINGQRRYSLTTRGIAAAKAG